MSRAEIKAGMARYVSEYGGAAASFGVDTWGVDYGLLDSTGQLLGTPVHYRDVRTVGVPEIAFNRVSRAEIFGETGLQFMELNTLFQFVVMKLQDSPLLDAAETMLMMPDLFHWLLTGVKANEFTDVSTTQMYNPLTKTWAKPLLERFGLPTDNTIATKLPVPLQATPASVGIVPSGLTQVQGGTVLADALRNVSGAHGQTGFGTFDFFVLRGFDSLDNGLVLTDGAAEPESSFYNLYNIEQVEVLKGPGAFLYGGNPLSGTINLRRKQPIFARFARFDASYGRFQRFDGRLDAGYSVADKGLALRLNALWQDAANYRDDKDSRTLALNPSLLWQINDKSQAVLQVEYVDSQHQSDAGLPIFNQEVVDVPRKRSYQTALDQSDQQILRTQLNVSTQVNETLRLRNKTYYTDFEWPSRGTLFSGVFPDGNGNTLLFRNMLDLDDHQKMVGNQAEVEARFTSGPLDHVLLAGFEVSRWTDEFTLDVLDLQVEADAD